MNASKELVELLKDSKKKGTSPYDTTAEVVRVKDGIAWVHIPGGIDETPAQLTINAKSGDKVQVRVSGGSAFLIGNASSPPTDDGTAILAIESAQRAGEAASQAVIDANAAKIAAVSAQASADQAIEDARAAAESARDSAASAEAAHSMAVSATQSANEAKASANVANEQAISATTSATNALDQLSVVENVVGVLSLLSKHGTYALTADQEAQSGKWYFTRSGSGTNYTYAVANLPVGADPTGYYELVSIDQAVTNYVSSHLALTDDGLSLQQDGSDYRLLISTTGLDIIGANGATVASYGTDTVIGNENEFHVKINGTELGFYQGRQRVAYINNNQLYITQSVVLQQIDLGIPVASGGLGQWSWKVHPNGENPSRNNLNLKWVG